MNRLLDSLNPPQRKAVEQTDGPLLVVAGAGSGKTRVLTHRVAHIISERKAKPWEILAVTFTNKAAGEMRDRIAALVGLDVGRLWISTFHSFCARFLRMEASHIGYPSNFTIFDEEDATSVIGRCLKELEISGSQFSAPAVRRKISSIKNRLTSAAAFAEEAEGYYDQQIARVLTMYETRLRQSAAFDFDDLLGASVGLLAGNDDVRRDWQERFRFILVDEYQDTNHAQYRLLMQLIGPEKNICVVGDEDQSIYGWRGADISNILNFESDFPGATVIKLEQNYRSTKVILDAASAVIRNNISRKEKTLWCEIEGGEKIRILLAETQADEADWVIRQVMAERTETTLREMVVLYRTNAQSRAFEETLRRNNIPYQIIGGVSFYQRKEIKDVIAYLKLINNPQDEAAFVRIVNFPKRALGETSLGKLTEYARQHGLSLLEAARRAATIDALTSRASRGFAAFASEIDALIKRESETQLDQFIRKVIDTFGLVEAHLADDPISGENRVENIEEFVAAASDFAHAHPEPTLANFLAEITLYTDLDTYEESDDKLTLMTLHNAKGLEFDAVFITGMEDGLFPLARTFDDPQELEEERRLLYVGATRARKQLALTAARIRYRQGGAESIPSRFLEEIPEELVERIDRRMYRWEYGPASTPKPRRPEGIHYEYDDASEIKPGQVVFHPKFGRGRVLKIEGFGESTRVEVDFVSFGPKRLIARYANLSVTQD